jgi:hypothetical protein
VAYAIISLCEGVVLAWLEEPAVAVTREGVLTLLNGMITRALSA